MNQNKKLKKDLLIILVSIIFGLLLLKTGWIAHLLLKSQGLEYFGVFLAGMLFTSVFTTVPATVVLGEMALVMPLPQMAIIGGLGALVGDFILFSFFRDNVTDDLNYLFKLAKIKRWKQIFKSPIFKVFLTLIGGLIIASPLPDELGLAVMGFSKTNNFTFALISFVCNAGGIILIALVARAIV